MTSHRFAVHLDKITHGYKNTGVLFDQLDLKLPAGSFHFLVGASGAGKSTLLKLIYMDLLPQRGRYLFYNHNTASLNVDERAMLRRQVGVVFQDFCLIDTLTVLENVALPLKVQGVHSKQRYAEAAELLRWVGLKDHLHAYPQTLSGGQQQRVAIARAVITRPKILLADEPTGNVDDDIAMRLVYLFEQLNKAGTTIVLATHNHMLSASFSYDELVLQDKKIVKRVKTDAGL